MQAKQINFLQFLQGVKQFVIPIYQRTYSWKMEECRQLWNDILRVAQNEAIPTHFLGSIVYVSKGVYQVASVPELLVIDGQQRLTTLFLLLAALGEAFKVRGNDLEWSEICEYYLFNKLKRQEGHYKLLLTQSDKKTLISILDGNEEPEQFSPRLKENYQLFKKWIDDGTVNLDTLYRGINKLIIVDIALEQYDNPQLIFESLNSTGMDLSQSDLIRNYILMGLDNDEQINLYETYWYPMEQSFGQNANPERFNRFMRDFLTLHTGSIPNMNEVYSAFKMYHQSRSHVSMEQIAAEMYQYARYFTRMVLAREKDMLLKRCFEDIKILDVNVVYPFLLETYADYEQQRLSRTDFVAILELIESYVFRRMICGVYAAGLNKIFAILAKEIDKEHYLESFQANLLQRSGSARIPGDEEFQAAFVVRDIYNFQRRYYLLSKLENNRRKEYVNTDEYTTEHILPQNPNLSLEWRAELGSDWQEIQRKYLHTIGNLTLTGYNPEMSDRSFAEKRDMEFGFAQSPLRLNDGLHQLEHWNAEEIEKRAQRLATIAVKIWAIPELSSEQLNRYGRRAQRVPLIEAIGPMQHPLAGFIPAGYKITPVSDRRFYYYQLIDGVWVQYGSGKHPWFRNTWEDAGQRLRTFVQEGVRPLGIGGELDQRFAKMASSDGSTPEEASLLDQENMDEETDNKNSYTIEHYASLQGLVLTLFESLRKRILNLDSSVKEEYKKWYIAYKMTTNFVDIEPYKSFLKLSLNMPFDEIDDPKNLCRDVSAIGHHGNGDIEIHLSSPDQLDDVMELIRQAFEERWEEGAA